MTATAPVLSVTVPCANCGKLNRIDLSKIRLGPKCGSCGKPIQLDHPVPVTEADFDKVISATAVPILVDFYADWCGPCKMVAPIVDDIAKTHAGKVLVLKVDSDQAPGLSQRYGIRGIPTLLAFRNGKESGRQVGLAPKAKLEALLGLA